MNLIYTVDGQIFRVPERPAHNPWQKCGFVAEPFRAFQPPCALCGKYPPPCPLQEFAAMEPEKTP
jgi:hypothetical protein